MSIVLLQDLRDRYGRDEGVIRRALEELNIKPIDQRKFGKGMMRFYDKAAIDNADALLRELLKPPVSVEDRIADLEKRVAALEAVK